MGFACSIFLYLKTVDKAETVPPLIYCSDGILSASYAEHILRFLSIENNGQFTDFFVLFIGSTRYTDYRKAIKENT